MGSEISISLREFDDSIRDAYGRLFPGDPDKSPELLNWRFRSNPHGPARFAVASAGDRIVGMIALFATRLRSAGHECLGYQAIDTVVDPSCRGRGLFVKMGERAQDPAALGANVLWGFPNANAAPGWYGRLGWTNFGPAPLLMRPLRSSFILGRLHPALRVVDLPLIGRNDQPGEVYADGESFATDADALWQRVAADFGIAVDRGGEWMRWRLFDKPGAEYRCVGMKSGGDLEALVATKIANKHGGRLCYVMEAIGLSEPARGLVDLLRAELVRAARAGAEAALAWCPKSSPSYRAYRHAGFWPVPPRIRPIEINFGARALREQCADTARPGADWYVSFLDSDTN